MRAKRIARAAIILAVITVVLGELVARVLTRKSDSGMAMIGRYVLLPYRPERASVEDWMARSAGGTYLVDDSDLGWSIRASGTSELYETNSQGVRAEPARLYSTEIPAGKLRIVAVGDSFTHGDEVKNDETWMYVLEQLRPEL